MVCSVCPSKVVSTEICLSLSWPFVSLPPGSFAGRDQSFPLVSGPGLDMQSHNYTYEQAAAFCSVRGLSLPLLVTDVQTMAVNTFAAPLEARFQTKLWSSVQNPTEAATSTPPETRGGVICRLPRKAF